MKRYYYISYMSGTEVGGFALDAPMGAFPLAYAHEHILKLEGRAIPVLFYAEISDYEFLKYDDFCRSQQGLPLKKSHLKLVPKIDDSPEPA